MLVHMGLAIYHVDAFTAEPFAGNPAAVVLADRPVDAVWMQRVAAEMNLSETAFIQPLADNRFALRWFTPRVEVNLCGHATLASAHVLWQCERADAAAGPSIFETRSGELRAERRHDWIELDFPADAPRPIVPPQGLERAIGAKPVHVRRGRDDLLVEVESADVVRCLAPDLSRFADLPPMRGLIVTAASDDDRYDFVSRFFAPSAGIDEDPVTGSAHCTLGPYWADRLGDDDLIAYQASQRGGVIRMRIGGDRITLAGQAVTTLQGELMV